MRRVINVIHCTKNPKIMRIKSKVLWMTDVFVDARNGKFFPFLCFIEYLPRITGSKTSDNECITLYEGD